MLEGSDFAETTSRRGSGSTGAGIAILRDGPGRLRVIGVLDHRGAAYTRRMLVAAIAADGAHADVLVDCSGVAFVDPGAVGVLADAASTVPPGARMVVSGAGRLAAAALGARPNGMPSALVLADDADATETLPRAS